MISVKKFDSALADPLTSPCVRMCALDDANICLGCYRSIDEICAWSQASLDERRGILARATHRREEMRR
jgi:hypothetical protein